MYAGEVIDLMKHRIGGHYSRQILLTEINIAQNEILALPDVTRLRNKNAIYLATTSGVSEYSLPGVRNVTRCFIRSQDGQVSDYGVTTPRYPSGADATDISGVVFNDFAVDFECKEAASPADDAVLYFSPDVDLGDTTTKYRLEQYVWPEQLVQESNKMTMPDTWITSLLYYALKMKMEESAYGVDIYNDPKFQAQLIRLNGRSARQSKQSKIIRQPRF